MSRVHSLLGKATPAGKITLVALSVLHVLTGIRPGRHLRSSVELGFLLSPAILLFVISRFFGNRPEWP